MGEMTFVAIVIAGLAFACIALVEPVSAALFAAVGMALRAAARDIGKLARGRQA